jgi:tripeptide aminopeptidase
MVVAGRCEASGSNARGIELLERLLAIQSATGDSEEMRAFVEAAARAPGASVRVERDNIYAIKGTATIYPVIVAHTDTVHPRLPERQYEVRRIDGEWRAWNPLLNEPAGIGGDDKIGIWIALEALDRLPAVKVAFFRDEEKGLQGASDADLAFFADAGFIVEADRRGNADFIRWMRQVDVQGDAFAAAAAPIIARHGYAPASGGRTDVYALARDGVGVAVCNLSCGYYEPHSVMETVHEQDAAQALTLVLDLCRSLQGRRFRHRFDIDEPIDG